jgi:hypothetical protein
MNLNEILEKKKSATEDLERKVSASVKATIEEWKKENLFDGLVAIVCKSSERIERNNEGEWDIVEYYFSDADILHKRNKKPNKYKTNESNT